MRMGPRPDEIRHGEPKKHQKWFHRLRKLSKLQMRHCSSTKRSQSAYCLPTMRIADGFNEKKPRAQKAKLHEDFLGSEISSYLSLLRSIHHLHTHLLPTSLPIYKNGYDAAPQYVLRLTNDCSTKSKEVNLNKHSTHHSRPPSAGIPGSPSRITKTSKHAALASSSKDGPKKPKKANDALAIEKLRTTYSKRKNDHPDGDETIGQIISQ